MPQRNSSGRGGTATATRKQPGNRTPNTPEVSESAIARMRVDELRGQLRKRGVTGTSTLRKDELVQTLVKTLRAERRRGAAPKSTGPARKAAPARKTAPAKKTAPAAGKRTAAVKEATAGARKITGAAKKAAPARKSTGTAGRSGAPGRKPAATGSGGGGVREGNGMSRSLKYAQRISSPDERQERPGRSLVTTDHEVIRRWAEARNAKPATIEGTEHDGRPGVLTFNFPGWREGGRLREISWDDWFRSFDARRVNFIYQDQKSDGRQSNFFRTESPDREDA
jgi:hypothetical protein